jgi:hypothetical protein
MLPPRNIIMIKDLCLFISQQYAREKHICYKEGNKVSMGVAATYGHSHCTQAKEYQVFL